MQQKNWKKVLLSWVLVWTMSLGMTGNVFAAGTGQSNAEDSVWTKEEPAESQSMADAESAPEEIEEIPQDETVRVLIVVDGKSAVEKGYSTDAIAQDKAAMKYADKLEKKQEEITEKISEEALEGEALDVRYHFTLLANAVSADVAFCDVEKIEDVDGVESVYVVPRYDVAASDAASPNTVTAGEMVGSYDTWASGYTGAGQRIAVIDTGLDTDHPSFDEGAFEYGLDETSQNAGESVSDYQLLGKTEISSVLDRLNATARKSDVTADKLFLSNKIPFAFNYVDKDLDVTHDNDIQGDHGTHVSGIAAANVYVPDGTGYKKQESGVVGIAPDAQLFVMKVFGKNGGAYPDDYMAAIEDAILLDADAVNLSLGSSSAGESKEYAAGEQYVNEIFNGLVNTDTVVSISAGNSGYWSENSTYGANLTSDVNMNTMGSPGSYINAFTVASANNSGYTGYCVQAGDAKVFYADAAFTEFRTLDTTEKGTEYEYVFLDGYGQTSDYEGVDVAGKIVVVSRGDITFAEKHSNAQNAGAVGVLIYNNQAGTISMNVDGSGAVIPCASIRQEDGAVIKAAATSTGKNGIYTGTMKVFSSISTDYNVSDGYMMSDFSSWGVTGDLSMKPEITAPGGNIYSTLDNGQYGLMSGTSMAAPSVAGMSALAAEYIKENNLCEKTGLSVRTLTQSLLMSTATPLTAEDGEEYATRSQGAGLANIEKAITSPVYILMDKNGADGKVKAELGDDPDREGVYSFDFTLYNLSEKMQYYTVDSSILTEEVIEDNYFAGTSHKLNPEVKVSGLEKKYDLNGDGTVTEADAQVLLQSVNGSADSAKAASDIFDLNRDGVINTADVYDFLLEIKGTTSKLNLNEAVVAVNDSKKLSVTVKLSDSDKEYLNSNFENGMYVDGFIYLNGTVQLSVPMLAFYGNWADASMYEPYHYLEAANGGEAGQTYTGIARTNYMTYKFNGDSSGYYYKSNMYAKDDAYLPERNAISSVSGDSIDSITYSLIRNASNVTATITNADTGEVYYKEEEGEVSAAFYSEASAAWNSTSARTRLNWAVTDADGAALPEGTKVNITVTALPAYYDNWTGSDVPGKGVSLNFPMTVDNTAPQEVNAVTSTDKKSMDVTVRDNNYVAAVVVYGRDKATILNTYAVNQTQQGAESVVHIEVPEKVFYVAIVDYAGNTAMYRVNNSGVEDTSVTTGVTLNQTSIELIKGDTQKLVATVAPESILDDNVTWSSDNKAAATVDANGMVTAVGAGTANITATTSAKNASGAAETMSCAVTVRELSVDLNAILWDENGAVHWAKFNSSNPANWSDAGAGTQGNLYMAATVVGDKIMAATQDSSQMSALYLVDPDNGYAATEAGSVPAWCTDMAYGKGSGYVTATCSGYVMVIDASGNYMGGINLLQYTGGNVLIGITYAGTQDGVDYFYTIDQTGNIYVFTLNQALDTIQFEKVGSIKVDTKGEYYYSSLYYDSATGYLFLSLFDGAQTLYAINANTYKCRKLGEFPSEVWPICGLYKSTDLGAGIITQATGIENISTVPVTITQDVLPALEKKTSK